jgi:hypothetical protein
VHDDDKGRWSGLAAELGGRGVPSIDTALRERELRPVRDAFTALLELPARAAERYSAFLDAALPFSSGRLDAAAALDMFKELQTVIQASAAPKGKARGADEAGKRFLWAWTILRPLAGSSPAESPVPAWLEEWMLADILGMWLAGAGWDEQTPSPALFGILMSIPEKPAKIDWGSHFSHPAAERLFGVHAFEGARWFRKESLEMFASCVSILLRARGKKAPRTSSVLAAAKSSGYRWEDFLKSLKSPAR